MNTALLTIVQNVVSSVNGLRQALTARLNQFIIVTDFLADSTGVSDSTSAIQNAINSAQSAGGGIVYFPPGTYKVTGTLQITANGIRLFGSSRFSTTINFANGANDCITIIGTSINFVTGPQIENFQFTHTGKTGGRTLAMNFVARAVLRDLLASNVWTGFEIFTINDVFAENVLIQGVTGGSSIPASHFGTVAPLRCYGLWWHAPGDGTGQSIQLTTYNFTVNCLFSGADAFVWDGFATTWNADQLTALSCFIGLHVLNTAASNSAFPQFSAMHNFNVDGASSIGLFIEGGSIFEFANASIQNTSGVVGQGSADTNAVKILADVGNSFTNTIVFSGGRIGLCKTEAMSIAGRNISLHGLFFEPGSTQTTNTQAAIHLLSPAQDISIIGCSSFEFGQPVNWKYGLLKDAGVLRCVHGLNNFTQAGTKEVQDNATDSQSLAVGNLSSNTSTVNPAVFGIVRSQAVTVSFTASADQMTGGMLVLTGTPGAFTLTTPTAAAIVANMVSPCINQMIDWHVANATNGLCTLTAGVGVGFFGTTFTIAAGASRVMKLHIDRCDAGAEAITIAG